MGVAILLAAMLAFVDPSPLDPPRDVIDFFRSVASSLADADRAAEFLEHFDKSMPGYAAFSDQIEAMVGAGEVSTTIDFVNSDGNDQKRTLELDWLLQCEGQRPRRAVIQCRIEKRGKKWKITSIAPIEFFKRE